MDFFFIKDFFNNFQTENVMEMLENLNIGDLVYEPWFLITMGIIATLCLLLKLRLLFATIVGTTGFAFLVAYTMERGTSLEGLNNPTLLIFIGGGAVMVGLVIYFLFIRGD
jgi:uncharacterized membrane protein YjjP (DUF1212 family)